MSAGFNQISGVPGLDGGADVHFVHYPGDRGLLAGIEDHWPLRRLQWFSKGIYSIGRSGDDIVFSDLRMGVEPNYVFRFKIGEFGNPHARPVVPEQLAPVRDYGRLPQFWERIWDPKVRLSPPPSAGN